MAYASVPQLRDYLVQVPTDAPTNALLSDILDRASAVIDRVVGFSFGVTAVAARTAYGDGTPYLAVPGRHVAGSVTMVTAPAGALVPSWVERDGLLVVCDAAGYAPPVGALRWGLWWEPGLPYAVTAIYGTPEVPLDITECCLEIAVRIFRARDAGFSDVVGVEGAGAIGYNGALPATVKRVLETYSAPARAGVW